MIHTVRISPKRWVYFGTEDEVVLDFLIQPFWFIEDGEPYRVGNGWRLRGYRDVAFHLGIAVRSTAQSTAEALGGNELQVAPDEIGRWGIDAPEEEQGEPSSDTGEGEAAVGTAS